MTYYKASLEELLEVSNFIQKLSRPVLPETENDVTRYAFGWQKHPDRDEYVSVVDEEQSVPIHAYVKECINNEDVNMATELSSVYDTDVTTKKNLILNSTGGGGNAVGKVNVINLLPDSWTSTDKATLESEGWFTTEVNI